MKISEKKNSRSLRGWHIKLALFVIFAIWIRVLFCFSPDNNPDIYIYSQSWPPLLENGSIPDGEGYDVMPYSGLLVPKFWRPSFGQSFEQIGIRANQTETIFLMIASYRDFQCSETVASAFKNADIPNALYVGIVDQTDPTDGFLCGIPKVSCGVDPTHILCKYRSQISIYKMDAQHATGPLTAPHIGQRLYRGQFFSLQLDAHCVFVRHWDSQIKSQWHSLDNDMAVLTHYMSDSQGAIDPSDGSAVYSSRAVICNSDFETHGTGAGSLSFLVHGVQSEEPPAISDTPQLQPFWAAGFSFSRGHFILRVPYDNRLPMMFQGEEISMTIRGFTHGYDYYAPLHSVAFHEYADSSDRRKRIPNFVEYSDRPGHAGVEGTSLLRALTIIGMVKSPKQGRWDKSEADNYGIGTVRPLNLFYSLFLIDPDLHVAAPLCPFVKSGDMHRMFHSNRDGARGQERGVDYVHCSSADTPCAVQIREYLRQVYKKRLIEYAEAKNLPALKFAVDCARRVGLHTVHYELMRRTEALLAALESGGHGHVRSNS